MHFIFRKARLFLTAEQGATSIEYALIATAMGFAMIIALPTLASSLDSLYNMLPTLFDNI